MSVICASTVVSLLLFSGSLFGSSSATAGLFGQQQKKESLDKNAGSLFGTPTLSATGVSFFGQSSSKQTVCVRCFVLSIYGFFAGACINCW